MLQLKAKCTPYENCLQDWIWKTIQNRNHQQQRQRRRQPQQLQQPHQLERQSLKRQSITATSIKRQSILRISSQRKKFYKREYKIWQRGSDHRNSLIFKFPRLFGFWMHPCSLKWGCECCAIYTDRVQLSCDVLLFDILVLPLAEHIPYWQSGTVEGIPWWNGGGRGVTPPLKRAVSIDLSVNVTIYLLQHMVVRWQYYCQLIF